MDTVDKINIKWKASFADIFVYLSLTALSNHFVISEV